IDVTTRLVAPAGTEIANEVAVVGQDATRGRATVTVATSPPTGDATEGDTSVPALLASTGGTLAAVLALGGALVVAGLVMRRRRRPGR
nr:LPXTG cell wall anchor domain-containing protein [Microthrixaceae bacterium]